MRNGQNFIKGGSKTYRSMGAGIGAISPKSAKGNAYSTRGHRSNSASQLEVDTKEGQRYHTGLEEQVDINEDDHARYFYAHDWDQEEQNYEPIKVNPKEKTSGQSSRHLPGVRVFTRVWGPVSSSSN